MTEASPNGSTRAVLGSQDLHVHTDMSDGDLSLAEVVAISRKLGIEIGIADHVSSRNRRLFVSDATRLDAYLAALDAAPVFRSAELCWCDPMSGSLARDVLDRFDYVIGSNHGFALPDGSFGSPWWQTLPAAWADRPQELMEIMVHNLCDLVGTMPISIVAHPTFMPAALLALEPDVHAWWTDPREDRFIEATLKSGVAIEVSSRYQLPHDRFLKKARQAGARFSLGSDAHHLEQVGNLAWAVEAARRADIGPDQLFVAERRR